MVKQIYFITLLK